MRYSAEHKKDTRERIVRAAARRFRSRGTEGAAIGDLMRDLQMTHGGFYRHFASKEDLLVAAFGDDRNGISGKIASSVERAPKGGEVKALIDAYLDIEHCDNAADGCPVAALATELARRPPRSRARVAFEKILKERTRRMAKYMPGATEEEREAKARMLMSGMAGTLTIARVLTDEAARRRFLESAKKFYLDAVRR
ncbi:MAG TPA: TetR/AcrR family transcriptional regulator, partial [Thermoanaerobaculia bacterium]|nr:TetR/AcrR family transcriptional regulator [Thermoanaerobaculia bacterium]